MGQERLTDLEAAVAASQRAFGAEHPDTLDARLRLALGYRHSKRDQDALTELEKVVAVSGRTLGPTTRTPCPPGTSLR